jgi:hypothetical protein
MSSDRIVTSRLLILQSKRLMLTGAQRRLGEAGAELLRSRVERLLEETAQAQHAYRVAVLLWGTPQHAEYWLVVYSRLIETANALTTRLRNAAPQLPPDDRFEISTDVELLEGIIDGWTESMRASMVAAIA